MGPSRRIRTGQRSAVTYADQAPGAPEAILAQARQDTAAAIFASQAASPLGPSYAAAQSAGGSRSEGYFGYRYKLLNAQGSNAAGGAYEYTVRGRKIGGFAAVARPVKYGDTGVMTFMVSHDGVVYEKNLGPGTAARAGAITRFDPDSAWIKVDPSKP